MILGGEARLRAIGPWSLRPSFAKRLRRRNGYFRLARRSRRSWAPWLRSMKEPRVLSPPDARAPAAIPSEAVIRSVEILRPPPGCLYRHLSGPPELLGAGLFLSSSLRPREAARPSDGSSGRAAFPVRGRRFGGPASAVFYRRDRGAPAARRASRSGSPRRTPAGHRNPTPAAASCRPPAPLAGSPTFSPVRPISHLGPSLNVKMRKDALTRAYGFLARPFRSATSVKVCFRGRTLSKNPHRMPFIRPVRRALRRHPRRAPAGPTTRTRTQTPITRSPRPRPRRPETSSRRRNPS